MRGRSRLVGVDAARGVALLGMMAVHVLPSQDADGSTTLVRSLTSGRSSATFAVLAGVGLALAARRWPVRGRLALLLRAVVIGLVGLLLGELDSGVAVILAYYACCSCWSSRSWPGPRGACWRPPRWWPVVVPVLSLAVRDLLPERDVDNADLSRLSDPGPLVSELLLTGYYPALAWLSYLLLGLAVGRLALERPRVALRVAAGGAALVALATAASALLLGPLGGEERIGATLGLTAGEDLDRELDQSRFGNVPTDTAWWLAVDAPHTTTPLDLVATGGAALVVLGLALLLVRTPLRLVLSPLAAAGSMPLSLYTAHVVVLATTDSDDPTRYYLLQVAAALVLALLWRRWVGRGPLELLLGLLTGPVAGRTRT